MSKKEKKYLPLRIVSNNPSDKSAFDAMKEKGWLPENVTEDEFQNYLFGDTFMQKRYSGPFSEFNNKILQKDVLSLILSKLPVEVIESSLKSSSIANIITEFRDFFGIPLVITKWTRHKIVYKIDGSFFKELYQSDDIVITKDAMSHLPYDMFYIDFSDCAELTPIVGSFVSIFGKPDNPQFTLYMVTEDETIFSYYSHLSYQEDGTSLFEKNYPQNNKFAKYVEDEDGTYHQITLENDRRRDIIVGVIQAMMFLHCENKDIEENPVTKKTYKKTTTVKNKFSEIRMWDVGIRYGKAITNAKKEIQKIADSEQEIEQEAEDMPKTHKSRKPVRPHVRRAHWQRYKVGKGRTETRINWIPPTFVCGKKQIPVTIYPVHTNKNT